MKKLFNNIQLVFIIILAVALILSILSRPSSTIDTYEDEINILKKHNKSTEVALRETETKLAELEKRRNEIPSIINNMDSDDITNNISNYLKRRSKRDS